MKLNQSVDLLPSLRTLNNDTVNRYLKDKSTDKKVMKPNGQIFHMKISPHQNYSNHKPSVINVFPSIGQIDNQAVYTTSAHEKQNQFHNSLDFEKEELPGIA